MPRGSHATRSGRARTHDPRSRFSTGEMTRHTAPRGSGPRHVSIVALPDGVVSTLFGIFDVMNASTVLDPSNDHSAEPLPFRTDIVGEATGPLRTASGITVDVQRSIDTID